MDARVYMDGTLLLDQLKGKAVEVNPGTHRFRFELVAYTPIEREVLIGEGEKMRVVDAVFAPRPATGVEPPGSHSPAAPLPSRHEEGRRSVPTMSYVLGGLGVAALVNFAAWGVWFRLSKTDLENTCSPNCTQNRIDQVRQRAIVADVSLGVGVASLAGATLIYLLQPKRAERSLQVGAAALAGGGLLGTVAYSAF